MQQRVRNQPLSGLRGIAVVLFCFLFVVADSILVTLLSPMIGDALSSLIFWAIGIAAIMWLMWFFVLAYVYTADSTKLCITRAYGKRQRMAEEIYFNNILYSGTLEQLRARYPNARVRRATRRQCTIEPLAIAYRDGDKVAIYVLQANEEIRPLLLSAAKGKRK